MQQRVENNASCLPIDAQAVPEGIEVMRTFTLTHPNPKHLRNGHKFSTLEEAIAAKNMFDECDSVRQLLPREVHPRRVWIHGEYCFQHPKDGVDQYRAEVRRLIDKYYENPDPSDRIDSRNRPTKEQILQCFDSDALFCTEVGAVFFVHSGSGIRLRVSDFALAPAVERLRRIDSQGREWGDERFVRSPNEIPPDAIVWPRAA